ncbi:MAG: hypothetical protein Q4C43_01490 [Prevotella sp.]|nr:hypothetical protein [Prevotella sp.]
MKQTIYFFFWLFEVCSGVTLGSVAPLLFDMLRTSFWHHWKQRYKLIGKSLSVHTAAGGWQG